LSDPSSGGVVELCRIPQRPLADEEIMRPIRCVCVCLMAMAMVTGCGGSDGGDDAPTDPGGGLTGGTVTLSATEKSAVAAGLNALATRIGAADADARRFANALAYTVQQAATATEIDVATSLDLFGDETATGAAYSTSASTALVTRRVLGYSLSVRTDAPGQKTYRGVIVWDAAGLKVIVTVLGNPNILNVTLPTFGNTVYLIGSQTQVWAATEGNISWSLFNGNSQDCPRPLPNVLSVCGYEDGAAPFAVSSSSPVPFSGNTASGSRTATLGNTRIRVLFINILCGVPGGPC